MVHTQEDGESHHIVPGVKVNPQMLHISGWGKFWLEQALMKHNLIDLLTSTGSLNKLIPHLKLGHEKKIVVLE